MFTRKEFAVLTKSKAVSLAVAALSLLCFVLVLAGGATPALAQARESTMEQRLEDLIRQLADTKGCDAERAVVQLFLDATTANNAPVTAKTNQILNEALARASEGLNKYIQQQGRCAEVQGMAVDVRYLIDQTREVLRALLMAGIEQCGEGARLDNERCRHLQPLLDEDAGQEVYEPQVPTQPPVKGPPTIVPPTNIIRPGFSVKLRGPFVPPYIRQMQEDVRVTDPISPGQCVVVFKETKGLMLRLVFIRMTVVADPWATPQLLRGTLVPVWALQWVPAEHVKEWNICNVGGAIRKTVTQRVVQDVPLNYFWRFYPKDP